MWLMAVILASSRIDKIVMKVYFVRHGQTENNVTGFFQGPDTELSREGAEQAAALAGRFRSIPVDIIFSSPFARAKQTAEAIKAVVQKEIVYSDLLKEIKRPSEVIGKHEKDPEISHILELTEWRVHEDPLWHYSDEENFFDLKERGLRFLAMLEARQEEHILCVTHGVMLKVMFGVMMFGAEFTSREHYHFFHFIRAKNTGISVFEKEQGSSWQLITWNDHAHLG